MLLEADRTPPSLGPVVVDEAALGDTRDHARRFRLKIQWRGVVALVAVVTSSVVMCVWLLHVPLPPPDAFRESRPVRRGEAKRLLSGVGMEMRLRAAETNQYLV